MHVLLFFFIVCVLCQLLSDTYVGIYKGGGGRRRERTASLFVRHLFLARINGVIFVR